MDVHCRGTDDRCAAAGRDVFDARTLPRDGRCTAAGRHVYMFDTRTTPEGTSYVQNRTEMVVLVVTVFYFRDRASQWDGHRLGLLAYGACHSTLS